METISPEKLPDEGSTPEVIEQIEDTGVLICHLPTNTRYRVKGEVRRGQGQIFINGTPIEELLLRGTMKRFSYLMETLSRERLKELDIELDFGDPSWAERLSPSVITCAVTEALTNLLGRLRSSSQKEERRW